MNVLYFFYPVIILLGLFVINKGDTPRLRRYYIFVILGLLTMESCLRGLSVGSDTYNYYLWYYNMSSTSWSDVLNMFTSRYTYNRGTGDVGYDIYTKIIQAIWDNFQFFLFISALFFFIPLGMLLNRFANNTLQLIFGFILYVSLFNVICLSGQRQEMALGLTILSFIFYYDKKYVYMAAATMIAMTIHMSSLLFLLIPMLGMLKPNVLKPLHSAAFFFVPFVLTSSGTLLIFMADVVDNEKYRAYGEQAAQGGATTFIILMELISIFSLIVFYKINLNKDNMMGKLYIMLPLLTFFAPLIMHSGSMVRISQFFHIYLMLLLPFALDKFSGKKNRPLLYTMVLAVLISLTISTSKIEYFFFWQDQYSFLFI